MALPNSKMGDHERVPSLENPTSGLSCAKIEPEVLNLVPEHLARKYSVMPLKCKEGYLEIATGNPDPYVAQHISRATGMPVRVHRVLCREVEKSLESYYSRILAVPEGEGANDKGEWATKTVEEILTRSLRARASDIHLEPKEDKVTVRYRIDGLLFEAGSLSLRRYPSVVNRLKALANMSIMERHVPHDGQIAFKAQMGSADVRVSLIPTANGERVMLRVLDASRVSHDLESLGFEPDTLDLYRHLISKSHGMVMVAGPTGAGKTTTLYSTLKEFDLNAMNVMTLEDPIEYRLSGITQVQVNPKMGLTFATGLKAFLRQDPDIIIVGELRDAESARIAKQAALSGHLVLSSLHAPDSVSALFRLLDMGIDPYFLSAAVSGVVAQRLVRIVCPDCRQTSGFSMSERTWFRKLGWNLPEKHAQGIGCPACAGTGYYGRSGVFEVLVISKDLRARIARGESRDNILEAANKQGLVTLADAALTKVRKQITTIREAMRVVQSEPQNILHSV